MTPEEAVKGTESTEQSCCVQQESRPLISAPLFYVFLTSVLLWADAFEYDLFVCLGIQTRSLERKKADGGPIPEPSFSPGCSHVTIDRLKTIIPLAGRGPRGRTRVLSCRGNGAGFRRGKRSVPAQQYSIARTGRSCWPDSALRSQLLRSAHTGAKPRLPGDPARTQTSPAVSRVRRAAGFGPAMLSETTPTAFWCSSKSFVFFFFSPSFLLLDCRG